MRNIDNNKLCFPFGIKETKKILRPLAGLTLVEVVLVILLLSIIGAVALSRILSGNTLNAVIVRDQVISIARTAQQSALGRSDVSL